MISGETIWIPLQRPSAAGGVTWWLDMHPATSGGQWCDSTLSGAFLPGVLLNLVKLLQLPYLSLIFFLSGASNSRKWG